MRPGGPQASPSIGEASPQRPQLYAALDLGTNNCRLLIAQPAGEGFRVVESFSRIVRLGEGIAATGKLSQAAMDRAIEALRVCAERLAKYRGIRLRAVATEACRGASNGAAFVARVRNETRLPLTVIGPEEEARLALAGCASLLDDSAPHAFVFDIGGGSTELIWNQHASGATAPPPTRQGSRKRGENGLRFHSVPIGVVTMAERYGANRVSAADYAAMVEEACGLLRPFEKNEAIARAIAERQVQMIGTSGTVTTLASVHLKLKRYSRLRVDGTYLDFGDIRAISDAIAKLDYDERAAIPCIGPQRADLVVGGIAILDAICRLWPVGRLRVADRGLREGILNELMASGERRRDRHRER
jgi:exopolyphosphatase/guanosine-5'-triphosphate,3'-diphosphate pyrophosphatase